MKDRVFVLSIIQTDGVKTHYVNKPTFFIGRGSTSALKVEDSNVSREHVKIFFDGEIKLQDLGSSNGTFVNGKRIKPQIHYTVSENETITLGKSSFTFSVTTFTPHDEVQQFVPRTPEEQNQIDIKAAQLARAEQEVKLLLDKSKKSTSLPEREPVNEQIYAQPPPPPDRPIQKEKNPPGELALDDYRKRVDRLLEEAREQMRNLKSETEAHLEEKKSRANQEIDQLWRDHQVQIDFEKKNFLAELIAKHQMECDIEKEQLKNQAFVERNHLLTEAESLILSNTVAFRSQCESEKLELFEKCNLLKKYIEQLTAEQEMLIQKANSLVVVNEKVDDVLKRLSEVELDFSKVQESLVEDKKNHEILLEAKGETEKSLTDLNARISILSSRKAELFETVARFEKTLSESKVRAKSEVEQEYKLLREAELKKFEELKLAELKELQKIGLKHSNSFKKFSLELSQEIVVKLEMLQKVSKEFNFEKYFEVVNSVIQVKTSAEGAVDSGHQDQLESWRRKQKSARVGLFMSGAMVAVLAYFGGAFLLSNFSANSLKAELTRAAEERQRSVLENRFVADKTSKLFDSYVDSTIYTENFTDVYLDDSLQNEWVKKATFYFLHNWKIDEQKTIQVLANSKSLVQNIQKASKKLTKNRLQNDLEKLNELESKNIKQQISILGTNVKYEAFKKFERKFFMEKLQKRSTASK